MKLIRKTLLPFALLLVSLVLAGCSGNGVTKPKSFFIAPTGYLRGSVEPCKCPGNPLGGMARRATRMNLMLRWPNGTLKVDAGNFVSLVRDEMEPKSEITLAALQKMGVHGVNVGLRDLRLGLPFLHQMKLTYQIPFISANVLDAETNEPAFDTYRIVHLQTETGPLDVAVIGITQGVEGRYLPPEYGVAVAAPAEALRGALDQVKGRVGAVVLATTADRRDIANWLKEIDAVDEIAGIVSCSMSPNRSMVAQVSGIPFTTTGQQGKFFDLIEMKPKAEGGWEMDKQGWPLNDSVEADADMAAYISDMESRLGTGDQQENL